MKGYIKIHICSEGSQSSREEPLAAKQQSWNFTEVEHTVPSMGVSWLGYLTVQCIKFTRKSLSYCGRLGRNHTNPGTQRQTAFDEHYRSTAKRPIAISIEAEFSMALLDYDDDHISRTHSWCVYIYERRSYRGSLKSRACMCGPPPSISIITTLSITRASSADSNSSLSRRPVDRIRFNSLTSILHNIPHRFSGNVSPTQYANITLERPGVEV